MPDGRPLGWWVGWVERPAGPVVFAFRMEADDFETIWRERIPAARRALAAIGAVPEGVP
jgi:beta-lactamase class D